jgi:hypothetical protein
MMGFSRGCAPGWRSAGLAAWLIACSGCGGGGLTPSGSASSEEATVHGKVMIKGVLAKGGRIYFDPTTASRQSAPVMSAEIGKDGTYTIKTWVGENRVNVETPETRKDPDLSIPQPVDVKSGDNTLDVRIPHP